MLFKKKIKYGQQGKVRFFINLFYLKIKNSINNTTKKKKNECDLRKVWLFIIK